MGKEAKNPKEHSTLHVRRTVTPAKLAANRANAKLGGRPPGSMSPIKRDLSERCRVKDMRHVEILEDIAENSTNEGYRLTAIRDLFDRGHGRPRQAGYFIKRKRSTGQLQNCHAFLFPVCPKSAQRGRALKSPP